MTVHSIGNQPSQQGPRRVALVTGGGGGIGQEICKRLAADGHAVAVADIDPQRAASTATAVAGAGADTIWVEMDVQEQSSVSRGVNEVGQRLGAVEVLVNCAGWDQQMPFPQSDEPYWNRVVGVNLMGAIRVSHAVLPWMLERSWGRIVSVSGEVGRAGAANQTLMAAALGGLNAFTKALAREVVRNGITVNAVSPGPTATPMLDQLISQAEDAAQMIAQLTQLVPIGRLGQPQDIAPAVSFFASSEAGYVTGQTLSVSGGMTMA